MPPGKPSSSLQSVLARFEQTIEQNNAAGVASGMYLTKMASSSKDTASKLRGTRSTHTRSKITSKKSGLDTSNQPIPKNSNRSRDGSLRSDTSNDKRSVRSKDKEKKDDKGGWKEFADYSNNAKFNASFDSLLGGDDQSSISDMSQETFGFDDVTFDDPFVPNLSDEFNPFGLEEVITNPESVEKKNRPLKEKRGIGRLGNRTTKSQLDVKVAKKSKEKLLGESSDEASTELKEDVDLSHSVQDGDDDDGGFSLTYVASRDGKLPMHPSTGIGMRDQSFHRRGIRPLDAASTHSRQKSSLHQESGPRQNSRSKNDGIRQSEDNRQLKEKTSDLGSVTSERDESPTKSKSNSSSRQKSKNDGIRQSEENRHLKEKTSDSGSLTSERDESPTKSKSNSSSRQRKGEESESKTERIRQKQDEPTTGSLRKGKIDDSAHSRRNYPPPRETLSSRDINKSSRMKSESSHRRTYSPPQREKLTSCDKNKSTVLDSEQTPDFDIKPSRLETEQAQDYTSVSPIREKLSSRDNNKPRRLESESTHSRTHSPSRRDKLSSRVYNKPNRLESESTHSRSMGMLEKPESSLHRRGEKYGIDGKSSHGRKFTNTLDPQSAQSRFFGGEAKVKVRTRSVRTLEDSERKPDANDEGMDLSEHSKQSFNSKVSATSKISTNSMRSSNSKISSSARPMVSARETYGSSRKPQLVSRSTSSRNY